MEELQPGTLIPTRDDGAQPIRWIGQRKVAAKGKHRPIRISAGVFGAVEDLLVSPQHRILVADTWAELLFGESEVLVKAKDLINDRTIQKDNSKSEVVYFHLLFDQHQIISANGVATESYLPGPATMKNFDAGTQEEILELFPEIASKPSSYGPAARPMLKRYEAAPLLARIAA